ncbi:MAG: DNA recombination/repair protein RecA, partial [Phycisphaeraceae bacterium]
PPFRDAEFDIMFNEGISASGDLIDLGVATEVVQKSGAWFSFGEVRLGQGRENSKQFLKDNPDLFEEIKNLVLAAKGVPVPGSAAAEAAEAAQAAAESEDDAAREDA